MRVAFLGPEGTFSHEALLAAQLEEVVAVPLPTIYDAVMAVHERAVDRALVPIENAIEGSVDVTLDTLAADAHGVAIVGEQVQPIRNCLIAAREMAPDRIEVVHSHPQASGQCAHFLRERLPSAQVVAASSTAEGVRTIAAAPDRPWGALGNRLAAELYGGAILLEDVDDTDGNETRFVWLAPAADARRLAPGAGPHRTSLVFWGAGDEAPGWLVHCLSEFSGRQVNLTRIESRPRRIGLGHYMFFADLDGGTHEDRVAESIDRLRGHCEDVRVLGSYAAAHRPVARGR